MLRKLCAGQNRSVVLTDDLKLAEGLREKVPVILLQKPGQEIFLAGFSYIVTDEDALEPWFVQLVWSRFYSEPVTIARVKSLVIRESCAMDLAGMKKLYEDSLCKRFLESPVDSGIEWKDWLVGYRERCTLDLPVYWTIADGDHFVGRIGCFYREKEPEGWCFGYALLPEYRGKGIIQTVAVPVFRVLAERFGVETLSLVCDRDNTASRKRAVSLGFECVKESGRDQIYTKDLGSYM